NPFYELTQRIFHLNLQAMGALFCQQLVHLDAKAPPPMVSAGSWRAVRAQAAGRGAGRFGALLSRLFLSGKGVVDVVLLLISSVTTALAVNDWLAGPQGALLLPTGLLAGESALLIRFVISGLGGLLLSMVVLDFVARLLRGIAESGQLLRGIADTFARQPRWLSVAALLTLFSCFANYNAMVSLISIKADLDRQSQTLQEQVRQALGAWHKGDGNRANSLHDYHAALNNTIESLHKNFANLAEQEIQPKTPTKGEPPKKGPRYFAKQFIVEGGYEPGVRDVVRQVKENAFARTIDTLMRNSKLDLSVPLAAKLQAIKGEYETHLAQTDGAVKGHLAQLNSMMRLEGGPLEVMERIFTLDASRIEAVLQQIVAAMDLNARKYQESTQKLHALTNQYLTLVGQLDNALSSTPDTARVVQQKKPEIPELKSLAELKTGKIVLIKRKSFSELKFFLIDAHGAGAAFALLSAILFASVALDLGALMLYGSATARRTAQERRGFAKRMKQLKEWEEGFVRAVGAFFERPDVRWLLGGLGFPDRGEVHNAYYRYCERLDPRLKDGADLLGSERLTLWFQGLFAVPQSTDLAGYNGWSMVIFDLIAGLERHDPRFVESIFPGLHLHQGVGSLEFQEFFVELRDEQLQKKEAFIRELQQFAGGSGGSDQGETLFGAGQGGDELLNLSRTWKKGGGRWMQKKGWFAQGVKTLGRGGATSDSRLNLWFLLVRKGFKPPPPPFVHTRRQWLQEWAVLSAQPLPVSEPVPAGVRDLSAPDASPVPAGVRDLSAPDVSPVPEAAGLMEIGNDPPVPVVATGADVRVDTLDLASTPLLVAQADRSVPASARATPFVHNALFLTSGGEELLVSATHVDDASARLELEQVPLGVGVGAEGSLILETGQGGRYPFPCRVEQLGAGFLTIRLHTPDPLFPSLHANLPPVSHGRAAGEREVEAERDPDAWSASEEHPESGQAPFRQETRLTEGMVVDAATEAVRSACQEMKGKLWQIQIRGMALRKARPAPQQLLRILGNHGSFLEQMPHSIDAILSCLDAALDPGMSVPEEGRVSYLSKLAEEAGDLLGRVRSLADALEDPAERAERLNAMEEEDEEASREARLASTGRQVSGQPTRHRIAFQPEKGGYFSGMTGDIARNGLRMVGDDPFTGVVPKKRGVLKLIAQTDVAGFAVEVVRVAHNEAILRVLEERERFEALAREGRFGNLVCEPWEV
ncbi:MAG: hypothetical protein HQM02_06075, partial [Magnetococcales bacterium]|nr:hypothetical protein [Magnetococcales bacterium]